MDYLKYSFSVLEHLQYLMHKRILLTFSNLHVLLNLKICLIILTIIIKHVLKYVIYKINGK